MSDVLWSYEDSAATARFLSLARERYSLRSFAKKPVDFDDIDELIAAAQSAPTARNAQAWHLWVAREADAREKVYSTTPYHFNAPLMLVLGVLLEDAYVRHFDQTNFAEVDGGIVGAHIMLTAHDLGLGTTWVGHFDQAKLKSLFPEMEPYQLIALFPVGYPAVDAAPSPLHAKTKPVSDLVTRLDEKRPAV